MKLVSPCCPRASRPSSPRASPYVESGAGLAAGASDRPTPKPEPPCLGSRRPAGRGRPAARRQRSQLGRSARLKPGAWLSDFSSRSTHPALVAAIARPSTLFSMELIPRISRAQAMDALSSMATVAGYKAVIAAANSLPRLFPMLMTAAGTIPPARVFVIGAGVAGLRPSPPPAAWAPSSKPTTSAPPPESRSAPWARNSSTSISAASCRSRWRLRLRTHRRGPPPRPRPHRQDRRTLTSSSPPPRSPAAPAAAHPPRRRRTHAPRPSVDLAAPSGGNRELTQPGVGAKPERRHVAVAPLNLPADIQLYARNILNFLALIVKKGELPGRL